MSEESRFDLLDPQAAPGGRRALLSGRKLPGEIGSHEEGAKHYQASPELVDAVNVALAIGAPLLLTGEPGTGKTQVAHYAKWYFGVPLHTLFVRSSSTAEDLLYHFDAVAYLHAANDPSRRGEAIDKRSFVTEGPLWLAYREDGGSVVLIDEIDKASRDFPNDLLNVLDQHAFTVRETGESVGRAGKAPPLVVITSNSERRLPEPFLRRCVFHHIELTEDLVRRAVSARAGGFPTLSDAVREQAIARFFELRGRDIRKKPATAELLAWLTVLAARGGIDAHQLETAPLGKLPALSLLIKDRDDLAAILLNA